MAMRQRDGLEARPELDGPVPPRRADRRRSTARARRTLVVVALACAAALAGAVGVRSLLVPAHGQPPAGADGPRISTTALATPDPSRAPDPTASPGPTTTAPGGGASVATTRPPAAPADVASQSSVAQQLLAQLNEWRAAAGRAPLTMTAGLVASAHKHNLRMAAGCGLSHQCPGEASFSARISAEGIRWSAVAENVATSSRVANTYAAILAAARGLNTAMHDEQPPDDGHRVNMLNPAYHRIGIDVIRDASGRIWLTQDFAD